MKILYFAKTIIPSRTANSVHVVKMCRAFASNGHEVILCNLHEKGTDIKAYQNVHEFYGIEKCFDLTDIPLLPVKGSRLRYLMSTFTLIPSLYHKIKLIQPDLVYGRELTGCFIACLSGYEVIFESHFPIWHSRLESLIFNKLYRRPNFKRLIVISEALRQTYLQHYQDLPPEKVRVAHDAADPVGKIHPLPDWPGRPDRLQVGYVGHLYRGKGIEVIESIAPEMGSVDFHIIGGLEQDINRWRKKISADNVFFHGFVRQSELSRYIQQLDICLLPNQKTVAAFGAEGTATVKNIAEFTSPLKMFDYMAHGKAIIASDLPVLREVLNDDIAVLVPPEDKERWIEAIRMLESPEIRCRLGEQAEKLLLQKYTWRTRAEQVLN